MLKDDKQLFYSLANQAKNKGYHFLLVCTKNDDTIQTVTCGKEVIPIIIFNKYYLCNNPHKIQPQTLLMNIHMSP